MFLLNKHRAENALWSETPQHVAVWPGHSPVTDVDMINLLSAVWQTPAGFLASSLVSAVELFSSLTLTAGFLVTCLTSALLAHSLSACSIQIRNVRLVLAIIAHRTG